MSEAILAVPQERARAVRAHEPGFVPVGDEGVYARAICTCGWRSEYVVLGASVALGQARLHAWTELARPGMQRALAAKLEEETGSDS